MSNLTCHIAETLESMHKTNNNKHANVVEHNKRVDSYIAYQNKNENKNNITGVVDSGNNKHHVLNDIRLFPYGVKYINVKITGIHGTQAVRVGIGTAYFTTQCSDGTSKRWRHERSIYNSSSPVNLICMNRLHYIDKNNTVDSGHEVRFKHQRISLKNGRSILMPRDRKTDLHVIKMQIEPIASTRESVDAFVHEVDTRTNVECMFTRTQLRPMNTNNVKNILNNPLEKYFNTTIEHNMIEGIDKAKVHPVKESKPDRSDSWYAGRMTRRRVPNKGRKTSNRKVMTGSHIVSDIGVLPMPDRHGNKYYVLFKCESSQYRVVYRMKTKDELVSVWQRFLADHSTVKRLDGTLYCRTDYLISDDDVMYVRGEVKRVNNSKMIGTWTIAPYTHDANPCESEMRRIIEQAASMLYDSGLPPSFMLDAIEYHCQLVNCIYTPICHHKGDEYKSPYTRWHGSKPNIDMFARFGSKTYVHVDKDHRVKPDAKCWIGFYLGPSHNMIASRIYRPSKHTVYDRYHVLYDSNVVYGDFMGKMYKIRMDADKQLREYYNTEVKELLGSKVEAHDMIKKIMCDMPWGVMRLPGEAGSSESDGRNTYIGKRKSARTAVASSTTNTQKQRTLPRAAKTAADAAISSARKRRESSSDSHTTPHTHTTQQVNKKARNDAGVDPTPHVLKKPTYTNRQAKNLLKGYVKSYLDNVVSCVTVLCDIQVLLCKGLDLNNDEEIESTEHLVSLIQLCEKTQKRIVQSKEPATWKEIEQLLGTIEGKLIQDAMLEEVRWMVEQGKVLPMHKNNVVNLKEIDGKWVIKYKKTLEGLLDRVRARWVLRGDKQRPYRDYDPNNVYSPVASKTSVLTALIIAVQHSLELYCVDISKAFTVSPLDEKHAPEGGLYIQVPKGDFARHPDLCPFGTDTTWRLLTSLYGLRQASAMYYDTFSKAILAHVDSKGRRYRRNDKDPCVFTKGELGEGLDKHGNPNKGDYILFSIHIDDKFVACSSEEQLNELLGIFKENKFKYTCEAMKQVLGVGVTYHKYDARTANSGRLVFDHSRFIMDSYDQITTQIREAYPKANTSPVGIPMSDQDHKAADPNPDQPFDRKRYKLFRSILGKCSHCANMSHPEIVTSVSILSQKMMCPTDHDVIRIYKVLRYLRNTVNKDTNKLVFTRNSRYDHSNQNPVHLLCDADLSNCPKTRRSRTGYCCFMYGMLSGWKSARQKSVSLSTCESEYVSLSACAQFGIWFRDLVVGMGIEVVCTTPIHILTDSEAAKNLANSPVNIQNKYSRHIEQRVHWFRELVRDKRLVILHIPGNRNPSDCFTKCLAIRKFDSCRSVLLHGDDRNLLTYMTINSSDLGTYSKFNKNGNTGMYEVLLSVIEEVVVLRCTTDE